MFISFNSPTLYLDFVDSVADFSVDLALSKKSSLKVMTGISPELSTSNRLLKTRKPHKRESHLNQVFLDTLKVLSIYSIFKLKSLFTEHD